jgi:hypothetical protein
MAGPAEGSHRKGDKKDPDRYRESNEPVSGVARPGTKRGIKPAEGENGECGAGYFMK